MYLDLLLFSVAQLLDCPLCEPLIELYLVGSLVLEPILKNIEILFQEAFFLQTDCFAVHAGD